MNQIITTHGSGGVYVKPFAFSYSKLKNFESCPKRHYHVDIKKDAKEEESEALLWGNQLHKAAALRLTGKAPLPSTMEMLEPWCARIADGTGEILVEQQLAITKEFAKCEWFGKQAWYRAIADVVKINDDVALAVDWKTGKILEDGVQLALMAACVLIHYPKIQLIRTEFIWLAHDATTRVDFSRADMPKIWRDVWPRIEQLEHAHNTTSYPAKPGRLCKHWCPVKECVHWGE
jgi:hypothetical protein